MPLLDVGGIGIELDLPDSRLPVVDASGRAERAVFELLRVAASRGLRGTTVWLKGEVVGAKVRLSIRVPYRDAAPEPVPPVLDALGGESGWVRDGDESEAFVVIPRA